nr:MAG TPA: hypothetical protein [Caudoviricetes sp.]
MEDNGIGGETYQCPGSIPGVLIGYDSNQKLTRVNFPQSFNSRNTSCPRACLKNKNCTKRMFYFPFS